MGRKPLTFIARECKACGRLCPFDDFKMMKSCYSRGFSLTKLCVRCRRSGWRVAKKQAYQDQAYKQAIIKRATQWRLNATKEMMQPHRDFCSRHSWVLNHCKSRLLTLPDNLVVYAVPKCLIRYGPPSPDHRWWTRYTWQIRIDKPGINPPQFGIPLFRLDGFRIERHPSCPNEWGWAIPVAQRWAERQKGQ